MNNQENDLILNTAYDQASKGIESESKVTFQTNNAMSTRMKVVFREIDKDNIKHKYTLDIGCGTGVYARELSQRSRQVLGMDLSYGMCKYAKKMSEGFANIDYIVADANHLPLSNNSIDVILSIGVFQHFSHMKVPNIIWELDRVLSNKCGLIYTETLNSMSIFYVFRIIMEFFMKILGKFTVDLEHTIKGIQWYRFSPYWLEKRFLEFGMSKTVLFGVFIFPKYLEFLTPILSKVEKLHLCLLPLNHSFLLKTMKSKN